MRFVLRLAGSGVFLCAPFISAVLFAQTYTFVTNDPTREQLLAMGKSGLTVAHARDRVIGILRSRNSCSDWFQEVDPNAASTFASLKFIIDTDGPKDVFGLQSYSGEMLLKHPYSARALENAGANSIVALNAKGAFFVRVAPALRQENNSNWFRPSGSCYLLVGSYPGDTLAAQITILLHELGHVIGLLPDDSPELSGKSGRNTAEVLRFCHKQIKAAAGGPVRPGH